jgi:hypothetical protein
LIEEARVVLEAHCGQCHVGSYETALPRALAVYDLTDPDWSTRLTDGQLRSALGRLRDPIALDGEAKREVPAHDLALFQRFVDEELLLRKSM